MVYKLLRFKRPFDSSSVNKTRLSKNMKKVVFAIHFSAMYNAASIKAKMNEIIKVYLEAKNGRLTTENIPLGYGMVSVLITVDLNIISQKKAVDIFTAVHSDDE